MLISEFYFFNMEKKHASISVNRFLKTFCASRSKELALKVLKLSENDFVLFVYISEMIVTKCPLTDPHYLKLLNQLMAIRPSSGSSRLRSGAFHIAFANTQDTTYTIESGRKKNKKARTWVSTKRKKGEVFDTFLWFPVHLWAIVSVYLSEIPTQPPGTLTHPLALADLTSESTGPSSSLGGCLSLTVAFPRLLLTDLSSWLLSPFDCFLLLTAFSSWPNPSLSSSGLVDLARKPFVWASRQNGQRILWLAPTPTPTETNALTSCHNIHTSSDFFFQPSRVLFVKPSNCNVNLNQTLYSFAGNRLNKGFSDTCK